MASMLISDIDERAKNTLSLTHSKGSSVGRVLVSQPKERGFKPSWGRLRVPITPVNWRAICRAYPPGFDPAAKGYAFL